jgi:hypothetical protein
VTISSLQRRGRLGTTGTAAERPQIRFVFAVVSSYTVGNIFTVGNLFRNTGRRQPRPNLANNRPRTTLALDTLMSPGSREPMESDVKSREK